MKKLLLLFSAIIALGLFSCSKDDDSSNKTNKAITANIDATSKTVWNYYSLSDNKLVGTGSDADNKTWFARKDWDIAICRYSVRTNSGEASSVDAKGGVYTCKNGISFADAKVDDGSFETDKTYDSYAKDYSIIKIIKSKATVITFKRDDKGNMVMPPVYMKAPIYIFKNAEGNKQYKLEFLSYKNAEGASGYVSFKYEEL